MLAPRCPLRNTCVYFQCDSYPHFWAKYDNTKQLQPSVTSSTTYVHGITLYWKYGSRYINISPKCYICFLHSLKLISGCCFVWCLWIIFNREQFMWITILKTHHSYLFKLKCESLCCHLTDFGLTKTFYYFL